MAADVEAMDEEDKARALLRDWQARNDSVDVWVAGPAAINFRFAGYFQRPFDDFDFAVARRDFPLSFLTVAGGAIEEAVAIAAVDSGVEGTVVTLELNDVYIRMTKVTKETGQDDVQ
jgi:hypothetical protein